MSFSFDTSIFIEIERNYPRTRRPRLWEIIESRMDNQTILVSREVIEELNRGTSYDQWIEKDHLNCIIETDGDIQNILSELVNRYPNWINPNSVQNNADPFVVAVALHTQSTVVSMEKINRALRDNPALLNNPDHPIKIPNLCHLESIEHLDLVEFLAEIGNFEN